MKLSPHNKLIKKLIDQGLSDREIQTEIRKVFNMSFKISDIQNKRTSELNDLIKIREVLEDAVAKHRDYDDVIIMRQGAPYYT